MEKILQGLVAIPSPCGFEHRVIRYLYDFLKDKVDECHVDAFVLSLRDKKEFQFLG